MPEELRPSDLAAEVARQFEEGLLPSTVERRLIRQGHPEEEVKRLVEAERERIEARREKARSQVALNNAKIVGLLLVVVGIFLPWSANEQIDLGFGLPPGAGGVLNGFSPQYFVYGIVFLALSAITLVLLLLTRTRYDPDNTRDRIVFGATTLFEALMAGWWVFALMAVIRFVNSMQDDIFSVTRLGLGIFIIVPGVLVLLVASYLEIAATGGERRLSIKITDRRSEQ